MKPRIIPFLLAILILVSRSSGEEKRSSQFSQGTLTTHVYYLASDELMGRGTGTEGIAKAAEYIAKYFEEVGLKPGGEDGTYFQYFEVPGQKKITDDCSLTIAGADMSPEKDTDYRPFPFSSPDTFSGEVVFVGYGICSQEHKHNDYANIDVKGKIALMFRYEPPDWSSDSGQRTQHAYFRAKVEQAREHGAVAVLIVDPPSDKPDKLYTFRTSRWGDTEYEMPMMHLSRALADQLLQAGKLGTLDELYAKLNDTGPCSRELDDIRMSGNPGVTAATIKTRNVIGILPGQGEMADEYVVFGAHYDHLGKVPPHMMPGIGQENEPDAEIHNGADDNASGTAGVLELAHVYAGETTPKRTLVFMTFAAEELGLLGSEHWVNHPTIPLKNVIAMINLDMIGRLREDEGLQVYGTKTAKEFEDLIARHSSQVDFKVGTVGTGFGGSDHMPFYQKKVPVFLLITGLHSDYHRPTDDADLINYDGMARVLDFTKQFSDEIIAADYRPAYLEPPRFSGRRNVRMGLVPEVTQDGLPGIRVKQVIPDKAAQRVGIQEGDRILSIDGEEITNIYELVTVLRNYAPGDMVTLSIQRGDEQLSTKLTLEAR